MDYVTRIASASNTFAAGIVPGKTLNATRDTLLRGEKGEKGDPGQKGDPGERGKAFTYSDFTAEQLAALKGAPGKDGYTPIKGKDYFDGKDGKDGHDGIDGYTPVKGKDYFDGAPGVQGNPGKDGHSPVVTASKSGTVTTISVDGKAVATINDGQPGTPGTPGVAGHTPTDDEIVQLIKNAISGVLVEVEYSKSTTSEINSVLNAGNVPFVIYEGNTYWYQDISYDNYFRFVSITPGSSNTSDPPIVKRLYKSRSAESGGWGKGTLQLFSNVHKPTWAGLPDKPTIPEAVTDEHINALIDAKLGAIENGSY